MTHQGLWNAIDMVAARMKISVSALAKACGLDATSFNKSKRVTKYGQLRWPSGSTIAKVIEISGMTDKEFFDLL